MIEQHPKAKQAFIQCNDILQYTCVSLVTNLTEHPLWLYTAYNLKLTLATNYQILQMMKLKHIVKEKPNIAYRQALTSLQTLEVFSTVLIHQAL